MGLIPNSQIQRDRANNFNGNESHSFIHIPINETHSQYNESYYKSHPKIGTLASYMLSHFKTVINPNWLNILILFYINGIDIVLYMLHKYVNYI